VRIISPRLYAEAKRRNFKPACAHEPLTAAEIERLSAWLAEQSADVQRDVVEAYKSLGMPEHVSG